MKLKTLWKILKEEQEIVFKFWRHKTISAKKSEWEEIYKDLKDIEIISISTENYYLLIKLDKEKY